MSSDSLGYIDVHTPHKLEPLCSRQSSTQQPQQYSCVSEPGSIDADHLLERARAVKALCQYLWRQGASNQGQCSKAGCTMGNEPEQVCASLPLLWDQHGIRGIRLTLVKSPGITYHYLVSPASTLNQALLRCVSSDWLC
ncbi:unnamed protein product [Pleuronectes platessa]|uniref:Uncharacterized protein n=1 Tax=Pleuronectes platessa TaxID=8262 RepID=A0A9N7YZ93_PLEPL|nr:unnamed protein product [Pleuronectes platessa]